ncbi:hypothetical protein HK097_002029 [Rhizophlyctis rosea]|uniref:Trichome birefringence-like C-terminal domain-containing protein n=1 Tax=Rhizophlyctis rosea TaxID=64517 RepID=A0AAD5S3U1_9FUNG|nr:hypothetical protein HK097_002029 [Rhizophlyctis rosea]
MAPHDLDLADTELAYLAHPTTKPKSVQKGPLGFAHVGPRFIAVLSVGTIALLFVWFAYAPISNSIPPPSEPVTVSAFGVKESSPLPDASLSLSLPGDGRGNWTWVEDIQSRLDYKDVYHTCPLLDHQDKCTADRYDRLLRWDWRGGQSGDLATLKDLSQSNAPNERPISPLDVLTQCLPNTTIGITGDSLSRQFFHAFVCTLHSYGAQIITTRIPNTTHLVRSRIHHQLLKSSNPATYTDVIWTSDTLNPYLLSYTSNRPTPAINFTSLHPDLRELLMLDPDHLIVNTGLWMDPSSLKLPHSDFLQSYERVVRSSASLISQSLSTKSEGQKKKVWYRTTPFRHFRGGEYDTGGKCSATSPRFDVNSITTYYGSYAETLQNLILKDVLGKWKEGKEGEEGGVEFELFDIAETARAREDAHRSGRDCSHYCLPGVVDVWVDVWLRRVWDECQQGRGR